MAQATNSIRFLAPDTKGRIYWRATFQDSSVALCRTDTQGEGLWIFYDDVRAWQQVAGTGQFSLAYVSRSTQRRRIAKRLFSY